MSFDLEVRITGICAFVPNDDTAAGAYKWCVVMPGGDAARFALDDELLCPHTSWIEPLDDSVALPKTSLRGMRVRFKVKAKKPTGGSKVKGPQAAGPELADLRDVCGGYLNLDPAIFSFPPRWDIMTQVLLREGDLSDYSTGTVWDIDYLSGGKATQKDLTHEVILTIKQLDDAKLLLEPYTGGQTAISLVPLSAGKKARVRLSNTCKEAEPNAAGEQALRDRDFKWYYELMDEGTRKKIKEEIGFSELPFPRYKVHLIGGQNCFPVRSAKVKFYSPNE